MHVIGAYTVQIKNKTDYCLVPIFYWAFNNKKAAAAAKNTFSHPESLAFKKDPKQL